MKMRYAIAGLSIVLAGYTASASAVEPSAVLQQLKGQVFVNQATAMAPAQHGMPLYAGNRVVVSAASGATVVYADGCKVTLTENSLLAIGGPKQCKAGQAVVHAVGGFKDAKIGQAPGAGAGAVAGAGLGTAMLVAPVIALAAGLAVAGAVSSNDNDGSPD